MRWQRLFEDFESRWAAQRQRGIEEDAAEESRLIAARTTMTELLGAHQGAALRLMTASGRTVAGVLESVGADWVLVLQRGEEHLIPIRAITWWEPASPPRRGASGGALRFTTALRALAAHREPVRLLSLRGAEEVECEGVIDRVGADHLILRLSAEPHGVTGPGRGRRIYPFRAIAALAVPARGTEADGR